MTYRPGSLLEDELARSEPVIDARIGSGIGTTQEIPRLRVMANRALRKASKGDHVVMYVVKKGVAAVRGVQTRFADLPSRGGTRNIFVSRERDGKRVMDSTPNIVAGIAPGSYGERDQLELSRGARELADQIRSRADARLAAGGFDLDNGKPKIVRNRRLSNLKVRTKRQPSVRKS